MSIYATGGATIEATLQAINSGNAGTYRISIVDTPSGNYFLSPTTTGIVENPSGSGVYGWSGTAPNTVGQYTIVWDAGTSNAVLAIEDLTITAQGAQPIITSGVNLCSLLDVRLALEMPTSDNTRDALISQLITIYSSAIINEVNREFAPQTGTTQSPTTRRFMLQQGSFRMDLDPYDLNTISSVTVAPEGTSPQTLTVNSDFQLHPVTKPDGVWTSIEFSHLLTSIFTSTTAVRFGYSLVDVAGSWGFPAVPEQVKQACILAVTSAMRRDISAFAMDTDEALQYATERSASYGLPPASRRLLQTYRRHLVF